MGREHEPISREETRTQAGDVSDQMRSEQGLKFFLGAQEGLDDDETREHDDEWLFGWDLPKSLPQMEPWDDLDDFRGEPSHAGLVAGSNLSWLAEWGGDEDQPDTSSAG